MAGGQMENPGARAAQPGQEHRSAMAAGSVTVSHNTPRAKLNGAYRVAPHDGREPFTIVVKGRIAWALDRLRKAGPQGCTAITEPGPRWSAYVFSLRGLRVPIDTLHEPHGGAYPGTHGRYILRASVTRAGDPDTLTGGSNGTGL